jgi:perosamine synthetase
MTRFLGYGRQTIEDADIDAVVSTLRGDYLTQGPAVPAFEEAVAAYLDVKYAVAVSSATAGLHIACLAAGLRAGDVGLTQPLTFVASANCIAYCGAEVGLVDSDPDHLMMDPKRLAQSLDQTPHVKVIIPVSFAGLSTGGDAIRAVAGRDRILIEDASHTCGAEDEHGRKVGAGGWADMTVFSFHPVKPFTTGEGGMVVTDDETLFHRLQALRSHGIERAPDRLVAGNASDPWWYEQQCLGYNYRMCDIQAALGKSQLQRIDSFITRRRAIAMRYDVALEDLKHIKRVHRAPSQRQRSGHHLYLLQIDYGALGVTRADVMARLRAKGVGSQVHYIPIYKQPFYASRFPAAEVNFPVTEEFYQTALTIPCFPNLTDDEVGRVIAAVRAIEEEQL